MQKSRFKILLVVVLALVLSLPSYAQFNGGNVSSPYSMFGIGDLRNVGSSTLRSMGLSGYAYSSPTVTNISNPASNTSTPRQTFFFATGLDGVNNYLKTTDATNSKNSVNLSYIGVRMPISGKIAFSFSMAPYSSTGYSVRIVDERDDVVSNIGSVNYLYSGVGDIAQYKIGAGWQVFNNFSIGANFIYYYGNLDRNLNVETVSHVSVDAYTSIKRIENQYYAIPSVELGFQYKLRLTNSSGLIFGGVYQPKIESKVDITYLTGSLSLDDYIADTLYNNSVSQQFSIPQKIGAGINYNTTKLSLSAEYTNEQFSNSFSGYMLEDKVQYVDRNSYALGFEYTPNRFDIRYLRNRLTYRAGVRYSNSYMKYDGHDIRELSVSAGVGIPFVSSTFSSMNVGLEYSRRGTTKFDMIRTNTFTIFVDFSLFTNQQWFMRYKFD